MIDTATHTVAEAAVQIADAVSAFQERSARRRAGGG